MTRKPSSNPTFGSLIDTFQKRPEALLLLAAGVALLMRNGPSLASVISDQIDDFGRNGADLAHPTMRRASSAASDARDTLTDVGNRVSANARNYVDRASHVAESYAASLQDMGSDLSDQVTRNASNARDSLASGFDTIMDQPLLLTAIAVTAGIAVASILPKTEIEDSALGFVRDQVVDLAGTAGDSVASAVSNATDTFKSEASARGLTPDGLKEAAGKVADSFVEGASGHETKGKAGAEAHADSDTK